MELGWIIAGGVVLVAFVAGLVGLGLFVFKNLGGTTGGWSKLVQTYGTTEPPPPKRVTGQTIQIGSVIYNRCVTLGVGDQGLYVEIRQKSILIPWLEFKTLGQTTLHWQKVPELTIGEPAVATLTVPIDVFRLMQARLPQEIH